MRQKNPSLKELISSSAGETGADSLFAQGESHSTLAAVASYNRGRGFDGVGRQGPGSPPSVPEIHQRKR